MTDLAECPRWRLNEPHYLNVPVLPDGTRVEWEHKETARETGRTVRKLYTVPMLLDPKDPADFNHPGEIVVTHDVEGARMTRGDYIFEGKPTPGMEPLNEAAEALTAECRHAWEHPINSLPANGGMSTAEQDFMQRMIDAFAKAVPQPNQTVPQSDYDELKVRLAKLEAVLNAGGSAASPAPTLERRA